MGYNSKNRKGKKSMYIIAALGSLLAGGVWFFSTYKWDKQAKKFVKKNPQAKAK